MKHVQTVLILMIMFFVSSMFAHPPQDIALDFNSENHMLTAVVGHTVNNRIRHYINKIVVELNGEQIIQQNFKSQVGDEDQVVQYVIVDAKDGDKITVTAFCNISGKKKATVDVVIEE